MTYVSEAQMRPLVAMLECFHVPAHVQRRVEDILAGRVAVSPTRCLSRQQAADALGVKPESVDRLARKGKLKRGAAGIIAKSVEDYLEGVTA